MNEMDGPESECNGEAQSGRLEWLAKPQDFLQFNGVQRHGIASNAANPLCHLKCNFGIPFESTANRQLPVDLH